MDGLMWWIDRWRKSTAFTEMTLAQQGAYRNLIDEATLRGGTLPNDNRVLGRACGDLAEWPKLRPVVMKWFTRTREGWRHDTLDRVLQETANRAERNRRYYAKRKRLNHARHARRRGNHKNGDR